MQKIEVIVRITKGHCPPQEQTIFEWIEMNRAAPDTLNYPGLEINLEHRRVFKNGQEVYMSRYEYGVLSLMARHPGQLFTKEQIFEAVWHQDSESCLTAVTNTIGRIRQKIEDDRAAPVYIRTISNLGYQFMPNISVKKDSFSASCSCVIFIAFRTAFICFPRAIASAFGIIITSIVLYRSCGKSGITSSFPRFCPIVPIFAFPGRVIKKR